MTAKIIIEKGNIGADGTRIDIDGLKFKNPIKVFYEFEYDKLISLANLIKEDGVVYAEIDIKPEYEGLFPAIGIKSIIIDSKVIKEAEVFAVGLSSNRNSDDTICSIKFD